MALKHLKFITSILTMGAFVAAFSAVAPAPAQAGGNDKAKVILGAAATILLLNELSKHQKKKQKAKPQPQVEPVHDQSSFRREHDRDLGRRDWRKNRRDEVRRPAPLPRACLIDTRRGLVMGERCLSRTYGASLPGACRTQFWFRGQERDGYGYQCLRGRGYQLAGRR
ncbi:hypothetical protein [Sagittula salina]|uniref:Uncharacterized protein n=1 Tax=Sagittula salina TaxID=2820268 RepID=A0A940MPC4_9RHOB|nr:hypothetical protein [Sagittula salina]MBP0482258.1 hypothetical protein [Sagittula salina]